MITDSGARVIVIGLNHGTAPVEIREKICFPDYQSGTATRPFASIEGVHEIMALSTCNRAEVIAVSDGDPQTVGRIVDMIAEIHDVKRSDFSPYLYVHENREAVRHVFRVASSLDSMVLGEPQILGQVKDGYRKAADADTTGPILNRLMHRAFFSAKRVRTETSVGAAAVSVAYVAVELAKKIIGDLAHKSALLIGAGEMAELAARHLVSQVETPIKVVNRTYENACRLAAELRGTAGAMEDLEGALASADMVITSTGSCEPIITVPVMRKVMKARRYRPVFLIDIAIPRDVAPEVNDVDGVYLYNIDDLQAVAMENLGERREEASKGETIVEEEVDKFLKWADALNSTPVIVALRAKLEAIRAAELSRLNGKLSLLDPKERQVVESVTRSIINKIAHDPISFIKKMGSDAKKRSRLDLVQRMFKLDGFSQKPLDSDEDSLENENYHRNEG